MRIHLQVLDVLISQVEGLTGFVLFIIVKFLVEKYRRVAGKLHALFYQSEPALFHWRNIRVIVADPLSVESYFSAHLFEVSLQCLIVRFKVVIFDQNSSEES